MLTDLHKCVLQVYIEHRRQHGLWPKQIDAMKTVTARMGCTHNSFFSAVDVLKRRGYFARQGLHVAPVLDENGVVLTFPEDAA